MRVPSSSCLFVPMRWGQRRAMGAWFSPPSPCCQLALCTAHWQWHRDLQILPWSATLVLLASSPRDPNKPT
jgi:hypothetical protein